MVESTRECCALFHIQYCSKCISAPTYTCKHYLLLLKSAEFTSSGRVLANYVNFVPVNMSKWLNGTCYFEIELRSGILELLNLQQVLLFMILRLFIMKLGLNHILASGHIGFGKYGCPTERLLRRPQKMNLECFGPHVCQISCL